MAFNNTSASTQPTNSEGLILDTGSYQGSTSTGKVSNITPAPNPAIAANRMLCYAGQTSNTSAGAVGGQALGAVSIPSGTANGGTVVVTNSQIGPNSYIFLQLRGFGGTIQEVAVTAQTAATTSTPGTFTIAVATSGPTTSAVDCHYWIVN